MILSIIKRFSHDKLFLTTRKAFLTITNRVPEALIPCYEQWRRNERFYSHEKGTFDAGKFPLTKSISEKNSWPLPIELGFPNQKPCHLTLINWFRVYNHYSLTKETLLFSIRGAENRVRGIAIYLFGRLCHTTLPNFEGCRWKRIWPSRDRFGVEIGI